MPLRNEALESAEVVIEAVPERLQLKANLFSSIDKIAS